MLTHTRKMQVGRDFRFRNTSFSFEINRILNFLLSLFIIIDNYDEKLDLLCRVSTEKEKPNRCDTHP